jgi:TRAP-type C4-dicarboxylate transport system substrate-binding protein
VEVDGTLDGRNPQERWLRLHGEAVRAEAQRNSSCTAHRQQPIPSLPEQAHQQISKPDLTGLKLRITPVYRDFFQALGATVVQTAPGEVYTALERGVVDGYGWPITGIFDLGWHEKTKYRVDPGFYSAEVSILINKAAWDKLNPAQKKVISDAAAWLEAQAPQTVKENEADIARQKAAGIQVIAFKGAEGTAFRNKAYQAGWAGIIKQSPEHGPKLKEFFAKSR